MNQYLQWLAYAYEYVYVGEFMMILVNSIITPALLQQIPRPPTLIAMVHLM